jgi:hypothetical protein
MCVHFRIIGRQCTEFFYDTGTSAWFSSESYTNNRNIRFIGTSFASSNPFETSNLSKTSNFSKASNLSKSSNLSKTLNLSETTTEKPSKCSIVFL